MAFFRKLSGSFFDAFLDRRDELLGVLFMPPVRGGLAVGGYGALKKEMRTRILDTSEQTRFGAG